MMSSRGFHTRKVTVTQSRQKVNVSRQIADETPVLRNATRRFVCSYTKSLAHLVSAEISQDFVKETFYRDKSL